MKKIILPGLVSGIAMLAVEMIICQLTIMIFPSLGAEYRNTSLFRSYSDPIMYLFFLHPFILGLILSFIWDKTKAVIKDEKALKRGIKFGLGYFILVLPGLFISYAISPYSLLMILSWTVGVLAQSMVAGLILAKMNK